MEPIERYKELVVTKEYEEGFYKGYAEWLEKELEAVRAELKNCKEQHSTMCDMYKDSQKEQEAVKGEKAKMCAGCCEKEIRKGCGCIGKSRDELLKGGDE